MAARRWRPRPPRYAQQDTRRLAPGGRPQVLARADWGPDVAEAWQSRVVMVLKR